MIEKMINSYLIVYYIIDHAIPLIITIKYCYQIDFCNPAAWPQFGDFVFSELAYDRKELTHKQLTNILAIRGAMPLKHK